MTTSRSARLVGLLWFILPAVLVGCAALMVAWSDVPRIVIFWLGLAGLGAMNLPLTPHWLDGHRSKIFSFVAWLSLPGLLLTVAFGKEQGITLAALCDYYYAIAAALMALAVLAAGLRLWSSAKKRNHWLWLAWIWGLVADFLWLGAAFRFNERLQFAIGLFAFAALLIALQFLKRLPFLAMQVVNTFILLAIALPIVDWIKYPPRVREMPVSSLKEYHSYSAAKKDRAAYARWWNYYREQEGELFVKCVVHHTNGPVPITLKPNAECQFMDSRIVINSRGFRGREIPENKGDAYRIVVLGESTTFGYTVNAGDKPWPELLEQMIRERLKLRRPVEVINAGIPSATLEDNLKRFSSEILPVQPDMIICYHGVNGFYLLDEKVPPLVGAAPPPYRERPLQLWADAEYGFRLKGYLRDQRAAAPRGSPGSSNFMQTRYANAYRELIDLTRTNHMRLVLATFPLAVNNHSPPDLVEFFRPRNPHVAEAIRANDTFTEMVTEFVRENPDLTLVDAHYQIDGHEEKYLDLMHLTAEGDRQLAENFFAGIKGILESELK